MGGDDAFFISAYVGHPYFIHNGKERDSRDVEGEIAEILYPAGRLRIPVVENPVVGITCPQRELTVCKFLQVQDHGAQTF